MSEETTFLPKCKAPPTRKMRITMAVIWSLCAVVWTDLAMHGHGQHRGGFRGELQWFTAALYWVLAAMSIWQIFRPHKGKPWDPVAPISLNLNKD